MIRLLLAAALLLPHPTHASSSVLTARYQCDATGRTLGLPRGAFNIRYLNGDSGKAHAAIPLHGAQRTFTAGPSAGGARYTWHGYTWWDAPQSSLTLRSASGKEVTSLCKLLDDR